MSTGWREGLDAERNMTASKNKKNQPTQRNGSVRREHFDNAGHLDPAQAERLLGIAAQGRETEPEGAFVTGSVTDDDLAEELGEEAVVAMTTGEAQLADELNRDVEEDSGGPFVVTSGSKEFAAGTDESNIAEATREPFPKT